METPTIIVSAACRRDLRKSITLGHQIIDYSETSVNTHPFSVFTMCDTPPSFALVFIRTFSSVCVWFF